MLRDRIERRLGSVRDWPIGAQYALSIGAAIGALVVRAPLEPLLGDRVPFILIFTIMLLLVVLVRPMPFLLGSLTGLVGTVFLFPALFLSFDAAAMTKLAVITLTVVAATTTAWLAQREQRRRESTLREKDEQLEGITENTSVLLIHCSRDFRYVFVNRACENFFGLPRSEIMGRSIPEIMGADAFQTIRPQIDRVLAGDIVEYESEVPYAGVGLRHMHVRYVPNVDRDGMVVGWFASVQDITERKQAELALRESETRTAADLVAMTRLQEVANVCIASEVELKACLSAILDAAIEFTGAARGTVQLLDELSGTLRIVAHRGFERAFLDFFEVVDETHPSVSGAAFALGQRTVVPDVTRSELFAGTPALQVLLDADVRAVQATPVISSTGQVLGVISTDFPEPHTSGERELRLVDLLARQAGDFLERRGAEDALRKAHEQLEAKVAERTANLERQTLRLRKLASELSRVEQSERKRLAALLHDDLQQLLVAAKMGLLHLQNVIPNRDAAAEVGRVETLVGDAIDTSRNLTRELRPPALYEGGLVRALEGLASDTKQLYRVPVSFSAAAAVPRLAEEFEALLFGCARELLLNAVKHSGTDEVSVNVGVRNGALYVAVSDRGRGFDPEAAERSGSNGFGLFSIRERLTAIEGAVDIESRAGEGCRVELIVPLSGIVRSEEGVDHAGPSFAPAPAGADERRKDAAPEDGCRVVIADDHPVVREGIANVLNLEKKIRVIALVNDGVEAVEAVERLNPDVVLLDINMPRKNGIEAAREIHARWPEVAIVGLSIQNDDAMVGSMLDAGALAFVSKSDDPTTITSAILGLAVT